MADVRARRMDVGLIGLAVMGENLARNIERNGFSVAVYNRTADRTREFVDSLTGEQIVGTSSLADLVDSLSTPRRIITMVKAGSAVDEVVAQLRPLLAPGDVLLDCGNSHFRDTERRQKELAASGVHYFGVGVSGGEEGALKGPSIMVGGPKEAYSLVEPILTRIAARVADGACCAYLGPGGAGHYVKMVHNGCEYALMQCIAEAYDLLAHGVGLNATELAEVFARWNDSDVGSYLVEIAAKVLAKSDDETGRPLVDMIQDRAGQKGTGKWASQEALDLGVPVPSIDAAVAARNLSALKSEREHASQLLHGPVERPRVEQEAIVEATRRALYGSVVASYAQAFALLAAASRERGYGLDLSEVARIWKGGCIIRSKLLDLIQESFAVEPGEPALANLMLDPILTNELNRFQGAWRFIIATIRTYALPCPALSASLDYFDGYRQARGPANLVQGLRDYFGAHTYERIDRPGWFHTEWQES